MLLALSASSLVAQGYGSVSGTVTDPTGAAVPNATVTATQLDTITRPPSPPARPEPLFSRTLPPARYSFKVNAPGFEVFQQTAVLQANQALTLTPKLAIGATTQTVEVTTAPPQIDTTTGTMSEVIDRTRVVDLPLNGRNAAPPDHPRRRCR